MPDQNVARPLSDNVDGAEQRRRQLRALLLSAADAARQGRRIPELAGRVARPVGRAIRDRVSMLLSAAG